MSSPIALRTLPRAPPSLRPLLLQHCRPSIASPSAPAAGRAAAAYHSYEHAQQPHYPPAEDAILSAALTHVPTHGFTATALSLGARDAGYLDISANLVPRGAFELVRYHLATQRLSLRTRVQFPVEGSGGGGGAVDVGARVRSLVLARLRGNVEAGTVGRWQEALGLMSLGENVGASVRELAALSDEIWFLAGDVAVDGSWYTRRAGLAGVYAAAEVYQTTDRSTEYRDTEQFVDRRLEEMRTAGSAVGNTLQWMGFQGGALVNLLRSKGVRI